MKTPQIAPDFAQVAQTLEPETIRWVVDNVSPLVDGRYLHWDDLGIGRTRPECRVMLGGLPSRWGETQCCRRFLCWISGVSLLGFRLQALC